MVDGQAICTLKGKDIGGWNATWAGERLWPPPAHLPKATPQPMRLKALDRTKPSAAEVAANPRARSAVMRVAERTEV